MLLTSQLEAVLWWNKSVFLRICLLLSCLQVTQTLFNHLECTVQYKLAAFLSWSFPCASSACDWKMKLTVQHRVSHRIPSPSSWSFLWIEVTKRKLLLNILKSQREHKYKPCMSLYSFSLLFTHISENKLALTDFSSDTTHPHISPLKWSNKQTQASKINASETLLSNLKTTVQDHFGYKTFKVCSFLTSTSFFKMLFSFLSFLLLLFIDILWEIFVLLLPSHTLKGICLNLQ